MATGPEIIRLGEGGLLNFQEWFVWAKYADSAATGCRRHLLADQSEEDRGGGRGREGGLN